MVALAVSRYPLMWSDGQSERTAVYALRDITSGDTVDLAQEFTVIKRAVIMGTTVAAAVGASVSNTLVTIPAGANRDAGFLMVFGCAGPG